METQLAANCAGAWSDSRSRQAAMATWRSRECRKNLLPNQVWWLTSVMLSPVEAEAGGAP